MRKGLISMSEAADLCSYGQEYLSLLARKHHLKAEKVGKKWFTTVEWLNDYIELKNPGEIIRPKKSDKGIRKFSIFGLGISFVCFLSFFSFLLYRTMLDRVSDLEEKASLITAYQRDIAKPNEADFDFFKSLSPSKMEF